MHKNGGKPPKLTVEDKLYIALKYLREYRTMDSIAAEYGVCKGTVCLTIQWVEDTLVKDGTFALPGRKVLKRKSGTIQYIVADVTKSPINRPKEGQKEYYSGKKKRRTLKTQVIIERNTMEIPDVQKAKGSEHDFKMYKDSIGNSVSNSIPLDADLGYLGIEEYHPASFIPIKSSKNHQLTEEEKAYNKNLARRRIVIEHINAKIKTFKSMCITLPGALAQSTFSENDFDLRYH
ncbi:hypothetical protein FACS1894151_07010 [Spirochaetia bacterium]|nr:hypothetical protein FACS1894151_07010 [Spirochaetia bacterium]